MLSMPARYRIVVQGRLGPEWSAWFGGLSLNQPGSRTRPF